MTKHLHRWRRKVHPSRFREPKAYDNFWFICDEPDCAVKKRFEEIFGKYCACHKCGQKFIPSPDDWKFYRLECPACRIIGDLDIHRVVIELTAPVAESADASDLKSDGEISP